VNRTWLIAGIAGAFTTAVISASCATLQSGYSRKSVEAMQRSALAYLAEGDPTIDPPQPLALHSQVDAGDSTLVPRATPTTPPQVSHELASLLPITMEENACLACHLPSNAGNDDIPIPESHFARPRVEVALTRTDPAFTGRAMLSYVAGYTQEKEDPIGARYNCVQCHTASAENPAVLGTRP
jgi:cytochrome c-type protein NapB